MGVGTRNVAHGDKSGRLASDDNWHMCRDKTCPRGTHQRRKVVSLNECLDLSFIDNFERFRDVHMNPCRLGAVAQSQVLSAAHLSGFPTPPSPS